MVARSRADANAETGNNSACYRQDLLRRTAHRTPIAAIAATLASPVSTKVVGRRVTVFDAQEPMVSRGSGAGVRLIFALSTFLYR